jgi:hypothetical protein
MAQNLVKNISKSCGCLKIANITSRKRTDPKRVTAHKVWKARYFDGCSFETFMRMSQQNCYYCDSVPSNYCNAYTGNNPIIKRSPDWVKLHNFTYNGLDRIDSSKNHAEDNIVPCCAICNKAKNDLSLEKFKSWIQRLYNHFIDRK